MERKRKISLITGVTGQDGSYLAELLLSKGYVVHAIIRRASTFNTERIDHLMGHERLHLHHGDITDSSNIGRLIAEVNPDEIYNLAAQSHVKVSFEIPHYTAQVDALGTLTILEAMRAHCPNAKFYQASTSELYGGLSYNKNNEGLYDENTPFHPRSPYGVAKLYGFWIIKNYREAYNVFACNGILFNHECLSENTPIIVRDKLTNVIRIDFIKNIRPYKPKGKIKQQWLFNDLEIWDGNSFVDIKCITATKRKLDDDFRCKIINTRKGIVETTNHHNLIDYKDNKIKCRDAGIGTKLKHGIFPSSEKISSITKEEAFFMGAMVGDGSISKNGSGKFINNDEDNLKFIGDLWKEISLGGTSNPKSYKSENKGITTSINLNGDPYYLRRLRNEIYTKDSYKKVPDRIVNTSLEIQRHFLKGYNLSDGLKSDKLSYEFQNFKTNSSVLAQGLLFLISNVTSQGFTLNFEEDESHYGYYSINLNSNNKVNRTEEIESMLNLGVSQRKISESLGVSRDTIRKIQNNQDVYVDSHLLKDKEKIKKEVYHETQPKWVYDIETESNKIMAGVGTIVVSNSERRGKTFVTRKITTNMVQMKKGKRNVLSIGNLEAERDWGHAEEYVEGMWRMLQQDTPEDYVLATGVTSKVRTFVEMTAKHLGWEIEWRGEGINEKGYDKKSGKLLVEVDPKYFRPSEVDRLIGDPSKAKSKLGWEAKIDLDELVRRMVEYDLEHE